MAKTNGKARPDRAGQAARLVAASKAFRAAVAEADEGVHKLEAELRRLGVGIPAESAAISHDGVEFRLAYRRHEGEFRIVIDAKAIVGRWDEWDDEVRLASYVQVPSLFDAIVAAAEGMAPLAERARKVSDSVGEGLR